MTFTLPYGQCAYNALPPDRQRHVDALARQVRGKSWPAICETAEAVCKSYEVGVTAAQVIKEAAEKNSAIAVTAFIERIGATPFDLDSPHQANLYRSCARQDYQDAAAKYIRELGGEHALPEAMETWELNHPAEMA